MRLTLDGRNGCQLGELYWLVDSHVSDLNPLKDFKGVRFVFVAIEIQNQKPKQATRAKDGNKSEISGGQSYPQ